jgi:hypothetical protein
MALQVFRADFAHNVAEAQRILAQMQALAKQQRGTTGSCRKTIQESWIALKSSEPNFCPTHYRRI